MGRPQQDHLESTVVVEIAKSLKQIKNMLSPNTHPSPRFLAITYQYETRRDAVVPMDNDTILYSFPDQIAGFVLS